MPDGATFFGHFDSLVSGSYGDALTLIIAALLPFQRHFNGKSPEPGCGTERRNSDGRSVVVPLRVPDGATFFCHFDGLVSGGYSDVLTLIIVSLLPFQRHFNGKSPQSGCGTEGEIVTKDPL